MTLFYVMTTELTAEQIRALECMTARRMANTGETREQACAHISSYLKTRDVSLKGLYGISSEDYTEMLESQGGVCGKCKCFPPDHRKKFFAVDHCHKTGKVRGLLCDNCNTGIGLLGDTIESLTEAVDYLKRYEPKSQ